MGLGMQTILSQSWPQLSDLGHKNSFNFLICNEDKSSLQSCRIVRKVYNVIAMSGYSRGLNMDKSCFPLNCPLQLLSSLYQRGTSRNVLGLFLICIHRIFKVLEFSQSVAIRYL
jgi:hypothetical protein